MLFFGMALSFSLNSQRSAAQYYTIPPDQIDPATGNCYVVMQGGSEHCAQYPGQAATTNGVTITPLAPPPSSPPSNCSSPTAWAQVLQQTSQDYSAANSTYEANQAFTNGEDAQVAACVNSGNDGCGVYYVANTASQAPLTTYKSDLSVLAWTCMTPAQQAAQEQKEAAGDCRPPNRMTVHTSSGPVVLSVADCTVRRDAAQIKRHNKIMLSYGVTLPGSGDSVASGSTPGTASTPTGTSLGGATSAAATTTSVVSSNSGSSEAGSSAGSGSSTGSTGARSGSLPRRRSNVAAAGPVSSSAAANNNSSDPCVQADAMRSNPALTEGLGDQGANLISTVLAQLDRACTASKRPKYAASGGRN